MLSNSQLTLKHVTLPILAVIMILGNGALIVVTLLHKSLRNSVTNLFVASLALSDLLTGLVAVPLVVAAETGRFGRSQYACLGVFCLTATQVTTPLHILALIAVVVIRTTTTTTAIIIIVTVVVVVIIIVIIINMSVCPGFRLVYPSPDLSPLLLDLYLDSNSDLNRKDLDLDLRLLYSPFGKNYNQVHFQFSLYTICVQCFV